MPGLGDVGALHLVSLFPAGLFQREAEHVGGLGKGLSRDRESLAPVAAHACELRALTGEQNGF